MHYIELLNLKKEPFSISPDPNFFYHSKDYEECLQKLELSIRLRRGLSIVLGDVGTGKTTLSRALIQLFQGYEEFRFHLILDPSFNSEYEFLLSLVKIFNIPVPRENTNLAFKEVIRTYLLKEGLEKKRIIVLIIDESQKMDYPFLELLRDFLNFETNEYKLLQLVILGQLEFLERTQGKKNFMDRVNLIYFLKPLNLDDTREMIKFRLKKAGFFSHQPLFTKDAYRKIHHYSQGYPRKIITICHHSLLTMLIKHQHMVDGQIVGSVAGSLFSEKIFPKRKNAFVYSLKIGTGALATIVLLIFAFGLVGSFFYPGIFSKSRFLFLEEKKEAFVMAPLVSKDSSSDPYISKPAASEQYISKTTIFEPSRSEQNITKGTGLEPQMSFSPLHKSLKYNQIISEPTKTEKNISSHPRFEQKIFKPTIEHTERSNHSPAFSDTYTNPVTEKFSFSPQSIPSITERIKGYRLITAKKGDSIYVLASRLYNFEITDEILAFIQKANPDILNLDLIDPGQKIYFPDFTDIKNEENNFHIYGVHAGYFITLAKAQACIQQLSQIDSRIYIEKENFPGLGEKYAVIIGPFAKIAETWNLLEVLKRKNLTNSRVIILN